MTLKTFLIILLALIIGIIFIKAIRLLLSLALMVLLLYFCYYTFFTYPGAVKFAFFKDTFSFDSYKIDTDSYNAPKKYVLDPNLKIGKYTIEEVDCDEYGPVKICDIKAEKTE